MDSRCLNNDTDLKVLVVYKSSFHLNKYANLMQILKKTCRCCLLEVLAEFLCVHLSMRYIYIPAGVKTSQIGSQISIMDFVGAFNFPD